MLRSVEPGALSCEPGQHCKERIDVDVVLGGFVTLAVAKEVSAGGDGAVVARCSFDEGSGLDRRVEITFDPGAGKELSQRDAGPCHVTYCAAPEETQTRRDEYAF